jgi:WD40 repeat protein
VHGVIPALNNCCIGAFGERLVVFETNPATRAGTRITNAKFSWTAHPGACVSMLARFKVVEARSETKHLLLSGASDGSIRTWSLMERPADNRPLAVFGGHKGQVSGLVQLTDTHFASSGADGQVLLWDTSAPGAPSSRWSPDGTPVVAMACHPFNDVVAVSTHKGLYIVDMFDQDPATAVNALLAAPPPRPYQSLTWSVTGQLYAGAGNGAISVFRRLR